MKIPYANQYWNPKGFVEAVNLIDRNPRRNCVTNISKASPLSKYTVIVSRRTDAMLVQHARFLANVSVPAAKGLVKEFEKALDTLEDNPFQFPAEAEYELPPEAPSLLPHWG